MTKENLKDLSFEEALTELEVIVRKMESGNSDLESSINDYDKGNKLLKHCEKRLNEAKLKVEKIVKDKNGEAKLEEF
jgi:exodeoxyribonuclease VII small subunit